MDESKYYDRPTPTKQKLNVKTAEEVVTALEQLGVEKVEIETDGGWVEFRTPVHWADDPVGCGWWDTETGEGEVFRPL